MRFWYVAVGVALAATMEARALVVDSFDVGALGRGPEATELDLMQTGLPANSVVGGQREWFALYGGSLGVNENLDGVFHLNHDRGVYEVAMVRYGEIANGSSMAPLNADFTAGGHSQITLRIQQALPGDPALNRLPLAVVMNIRSGVGTPNTAGASFAVRPRVSGDAFVVQFPFSSFTGPQGVVDFRDIDGVSLSFFVEDHVSFVIDEIVTSAGLPGDYNLDGSVNAADYTVWQDNLGKNVSLPNESPEATTRGVVDAEDLEFWKSQFGQAFPAATGGAGGVSAVPEPGTWLMCSLAAALLVAQRRGRMRG